MSVITYATRVGAAGVLALTFGGVALADTVDVSNTGAGSTQQVTINNTTTNNETNTNVVSITNSNQQGATTGSIVADRNTQIAGPVSTGNASNQVSQSTTVTIGNQTGGGMGNGDNGGSPGGGSGNGSTGTTTGGGSGGSVLGASTTGGLGAGVSVATLPEVGASAAMDVSALRALKPSTAAPTSGLAAQTSLTVPFLIVAALLSLAGAIGSAIYGQRQEAKQRI